MGSFLRNLQQTTCSRSPLPLPLWLYPMLLLCLTAGSRQPSTPPTTSTALSLRSATRAPLSTLLSLLMDTVTLLPLLPMPLLPQCTSLLLKSNGANIQTLRNQIIPSSPPHPRPRSQLWLWKIFLLDQIQ